MEWESEIRLGSFAEATIYRMRLYILFMTAMAFILPVVLEIDERVVFIVTYFIAFVILLNWQIRRSMKNIRKIAGGTPIQKYKLTKTRLLVTLGKTKTEFERKQLECTHITTTYVLIKFSGVKNVSLYFPFDDVETRDAFLKEFNG